LLLHVLQNIPVEVQIYFALGSAAHYYDLNIKFCLGGDMFRKFLTLAAFVSVALFVGAAWAGSSGGPPGGGGGEGGTGAEPEVLAMILFSLIPGAFFARKALNKD